MKSISFELSQYRDGARRMGDYRPSRPYASNTGMAEASQFMARQTEITDYRSMRAWREALHRFTMSRNGCRSVSHVGVMSRQKRADQI